VLSKTDSEFPLQLLDRITPQVRDTLNLMRASRINSAILAYEALNGPYDWNRYPLAPLGCKAIVYEDGYTRGSWASRGIDGWYLGPSKDHYRCALYYIPKTRAYCISGSTELFPQHFQLPNLTADQHFRELMDELAYETAMANKTPMGKCLIKLLQSRIKQILDPIPVPTAQDAQEQEQRVREQQQLVIDNTPILTVPRISNAPPIKKARNPTAKRVLKNTPCLHRQQTRNNTPGAVPAIQSVNVVTNSTQHRHVVGQKRVAQQSKTNDGNRQSQRIHGITTPTPYIPIPRGARQRIMTRQAINVLTVHKEANANTTYTPRCLIKHVKKGLPVMFEHFACPMVHPIMGITISSYKKLMNDPATAKVWQTAFGKEFGGMAQGDNKSGQKGTNAIFVMKHDKLAQILCAGKKFTFAHPVVNHRPQKEDPNQIWITAMGNLVSYEGELSVGTADINTAKIHWNSVNSTKKAKYMCLDIIFFYLTAALEYYE
jgi:hypothetical protein